MKQIDLDQLKLGQKGITPTIAAFLVEATIFCLVESGHASGTVLKVTGDFEEEVEVHWSGELTEQMRRSWKDQREVTEYGATAIAALLLAALTNYEIISRADQGEGADYFIGIPETVEIKAVLEVSGIWKENSKNTLNVRVNRKIRQLIERQTKLPSFIIVTEFGEPKAKILRHE
ncbi:MAG: hypothetical protein AAGG68_23615 [Bacteroidota bacterium]